MSGAELVCTAVAQVLLRFDDERHWLRIAPRLIGHLFPRLLRQSEYNTRLRQLALLMEAAVRWLADATPAAAEQLRQRVEAVIWTLKNQLGLERHGGRVPAGLRARVIQRLLALNACIWHNWLIGAPVKRSLIAYDHV